MKSKLTPVKINITVVLSTIAIIFSCSKPDLVVNQTHGSGGPNDPLIVSTASANVATDSIVSDSIAKDTITSDSIPKDSIPMVSIPMDSIPAAITVDSVAPDFIIGQRFR